MSLATSADIKAVLSVAGYVSQGDDDGDGLVSTTEEAAWVTFALNWADREIYKRLLRRYKPAIITASAMAAQFAAIIAACTYCRKRGDEPPDSLQQWHDEVLIELDGIRDKKFDLQAGDGTTGDLAPERAAARPLLINQGFDPRFQRPQRRQPLQSTTRKSTKPVGYDYRDTMGAFQ